MRDRLVLPDVSAGAWEAFQDGRQNALATELTRCWARARSLGASPDGVAAEDELVRGGALQLHTEQLAWIRSLGDSVLDRATARAAEHDFVLLLADPDGVVVRTQGGGDFADDARQMRLIEGATWSEAARGTNAIGTALAANRATEVYGHSHFGRRYHDLVCYAAPIRGLDGRPLAVLDATSRLASADPAVGRIVFDAARSLEDVVRRHAYASASVSLTRALARSLDRARDPALLVEAPGAIGRANTAACELFGANLHGADPFLMIGLDWNILVAEALSPSPGGRPIAVRGRAWRAHVEPITTQSGAIVSFVVALEPGRMIAKGRAPTQTIVEPFAPIYSEDPTLDTAIAWTRKLAPSELPIMLLAETGSGKELFAQAIHAASARASGPWLAINCGAVTPSLLETELFGYAAGAFTGAERAGKTGLFHAANGGTLFLDEVAEMTQAMQAALLRVVETGTYRRVGDTRVERTDVRIVCATCRDLGALVAAGTFRNDLYYRLKGATVRIPPLRERTDLVALAHYLLGGEATLSPDAEAALAGYAWPGNVRELKSVLAVARVASGDATVIELAHLPTEIAEVAPTGATPLVDAERDVLVRALAESRNNISEAARRLGVARTTVQRMKRRLGL